MTLDDEAHDLIKLYMTRRNLGDESEVVNILIKTGFRASEGKSLSEFQKVQ